MKKSPLEYVYNDAFFNITDQKYALGDSPKIFAEIIKTHYNPKSVVDIGCGCGLYLQELEKLGIKIFGIDGSPAASRNLVIDRSKFLLQDVTVDFFLPEQFDCVICFEVAEHISTDKSEVLVDNITRTSDLVFFATAPKGQGGHDHINEQDAQFWIDKFFVKGYHLLVADTVSIKKTLLDQGVIFWLSDNILIFKKANN
ncbi:class I SAM-dependent methyltransferase [Patescibacteria group bacterium]|nr:class I SAM-dependent methyltransferase [Patescibacteria group bacterium]